MLGEAEKAMSSNLSENDRTISYDDNVAVDVDIKKLLEQLADNYSEQMLRETIDIVYPQSTKANIHNIRGFYVTTIAAIQTFLLERNLEISSMLGNDENVWQRQNKFKDVTEFRRWLFNVLRATIEAVLENEVNSHEKIVSEMIDYINLNYKTITNTEQVAGAVYISESYARTIFRKYTGMTIQQYLTTVRMDEAKRLLAKPGIRIYEVAEGVGYSNQTYFVSRFQKEVGISPKKFRELLLKKEGGE